MVDINRIEWAGCGHARGDGLKVKKFIWTLVYFANEIQAPSSKNLLCLCIVTQRKSDLIHQAAPDQHNAIRWVPRLIRLRKR
jgi:hypothetical protein